MEAEYAVKKRTKTQVITGPAVTQTYKGNGLHNNHLLQSLLTDIQQSMVAGLRMDFTQTATSEALTVLL